MHRHSHFAFTTFLLTSMKKRKCPTFIVFFVEIPPRVYVQCARTFFSLLGWSKKAAALPPGEKCVTLTVIATTGEGGGRRAKSVCKEERGGGRSPLYLSYFRTVSLPSLHRSGPLAKSPADAGRSEGGTDRRATEEDLQLLSLSLLRVKLL